MKINKKNLIVSLLLALVFIFGTIYRLKVILDNNKMSQTAAKEVSESIRSSILQQCENEYSLNCNDSINVCNRDAECSKMIKDYQTTHNLQTITVYNYREASLEFINQLSGNTGKIH